jgi:hypothetical protein
MRQRLPECHKRAPVICEAIVLSAANIAYAFKGYELHPSNN